MIKLTRQPSTLTVQRSVREIEADIRSSEADVNAKYKALDNLDDQKTALLNAGAGDDEIDAFEANAKFANRGLERAQARLAKLRDDLLVAQAGAKDAADAAARDRVRARVNALDAKAPEIRAAMALLAWAVREEQWAYEQIGIMRRDYSPGVDLPDLPFRTLRFSAASPLVAVGTIMKSFAKDLKNTLRIGGPDAYEMREVPVELPPFDPERDYDPPPLFRTTEIPRFCRDDPFYSIPYGQKVV
jgi:hypothetical protein